MTQSRAPIRARLATLLQQALDGAGLPSVALSGTPPPLMRAVYPYRRTNFIGQRYAVTITSAGSDRPRETFDGNSGAFAIDVHVFIQYADLANGWTEADADDAADVIESTIGELVARNQENDTWNTIRYRASSESRTITLRGAEIRYERIPLEITVF